MTRNYSSSRAFSRAQHRWDSMTPDDDPPTCDGHEGRYHSRRVCDDTATVETDDGDFFCEACYSARSLDSDREHGLLDAGRFEILAILRGRVLSLRRQVDLLDLCDLSETWAGFAAIESEATQLDESVAEASPSVADEDWLDEVGDLLQALSEAVNEVEHDLDQMIGEGWADPLYEEAVQVSLESNVLPTLRESLDTVLRFCEEWSA